MRKRERMIRVVFSICGVVLGGISVGFLKLAAFGVDPYQALMTGLNKVIPIPFGTLYLIVGLLLLCFSFIVDRHYVGLASVLLLSIQGYIIEFSRQMLFLAFPAASILVRMISFLIGIALLCFSMAIYFTSDLGVSSYDAISLIVTHTWKRGKFKFNRIISDCICVIAGSAAYLISGEKLASLPTVVGIGTIITAFCTGPLIDYFQNKVVRPIYQKLSSTNEK